MTGRRLLLLMILLAAVGIPAGILQTLCVGRSCPAEPEAESIPFCPLPDALREAIVNGYREGRSAEVLAVGASTPIYTEVGGIRVPWPSLGVPIDGRVPLALAGPGIYPGAPIPGAVTLDRVAPTVSRALGFERPFPEVRSGTEMPGVATTAEERPRLVLLIAWKGTGSSELEEGPDGWPFLASLIEEGAGTLDAETGSLPMDPAATLTTIGTGGLPSQHGITGSFIRNDLGMVVEAYGPEAPVSVIASLADDLEHGDRRTLVGLIATDARDGGLVGGDWYADQEPVDVVLGDAAAAPAAMDLLLSSGSGADEIPDVVGITLDGSIRRMDRLTRRIVTEARTATRESTLVVVTGTGSAERSGDAVADAAVVEPVEEAIPGQAPLVEAVVPGGLFLDQEVLGTQQVTGQAVVAALQEAELPDGERMMADVFQGFAVSFSRYC